ncbi:glycosyltransferase family 4 protein [Singulisphaera rosea]
MPPRISGNDDVRLRVLISAYCVSPTWGSEPGVGWNYCTRLARHHDITVLTCPGSHGGDEFRETVEESFRDRPPIDGLDIRYVPQPFLSRWLQGDDRLRRFTVNYVGYAAWQRAALRVARQLHAEEPFDVIHHLNVIGFREPGYLWTLEAPFVWGPVGGASDTPLRFLPRIGGVDAFLLGFRGAANRWQRRVAVRSRKAAQAARRIWVVGEEEQRLFSRWGRDDVENMLPVGTEPDPDPTLRTYDGGRPLRLVWTGTLTGRKALPILLEAISQLSEPRRVELTVVGEGSRRREWTSLADRLGSSERVRWLGHIPRHEALGVMRRSDVLVHTSVEEGGPSVVSEALSLGLPVLCHDACGMAVVVNESCGIKVPLRDFRTSVEGFHRAIVDLLSEPRRVRRLSEGAIRRASEFDWEANIERISRAYREVAAEKAVDRLRLCV